MSSVLTDHVRSPGDHLEMPTVRFAAPATITIIGRHGVPQ
jgi:hypothetical protein